MTSRPRGGYFTDHWILRNLVGATTRDELEEQETKLAQDRELDLLLGEGPDLTDLAPSERVRAIHRFLFEEVYEWAGEYRLDGIRKRPDEPFLPEGLIESRMQRLDEQLADPSSDVAMRDAPIDFLAERFAELNYIHPFMEGNGRTQREFWRQYAAEHDVTLDWERATTQQNHDAARQAYLGRLEPLRDLIATVADDATTPPESPPNRGGSGSHGPQPRLLKGVPGAGRWTSRSRPDDPTVSL